MTKAILTCHFDYPYTSILKNLQYVKPPIQESLFCPQGRKPPEIRDSRGLGDGQFAKHQRLQPFTKHNEKAQLPLI